VRICLSNLTEALIEFTERKPLALTHQTQRPAGVRARPVRPVESGIDKC
jgi:hypothetical protein